MDNLDKYFFQPKKFEDILGTAKIVIDTNVLLAAYQYRNITFRELIDTLKALNEQKRLLIPSHVLKEFFKNRPQRIVEIIQTVQQVRDGLTKVKEINNIETKLPSLDYLTCNIEIKQSENDLKYAYDEYNKRIKAYKEELTKLINELKSFFNYDPILVNYSSIFKDSFFSPVTLKDEEQILKDFNERVKKGLPPGYKDGKKVQNGEGDYIIWDHILQIKDSDVIFISADNKPDWVYKDPDGNVINGRRELVEEFYEKSEGKSFCIVHPSVFIKAYNPSVNKEVIQDLNTTLNEYKNEYIFEIKGSKLDGEILIDKLIDVLKPLNIPLRYFINYNSDWKVSDIVIKTNTILADDVLEYIKFKLNDDDIEVLIESNIS